MILGISVVKNEADVIEAMIRHNLRFLDRIIIIDNGSADETRDIVTALESEGCCCTLHEDFGVDHNQHEILTTWLARAAKEYNPSRVVPLDADEFLNGDPDRFRAEMLQSDEVLTFAWVTYVPTPKDNPAEANPILRLTHRRRREAPPWHKVSIPQKHLATSRLTKGSHGVEQEDPKTGAISRLPSKPSRTTNLAHFPIRSHTQLASKVLIGSWSVRLRNLRNKRSREAFQWIELAERILHSEQIDDEELSKIAISYAANKSVRIQEDPIRTDIVLTQTTAPPKDQLMRQILQYTNELVTHLERVG